MKLHCDVRARARSLLCICGALGALALSANVMANGLLAPDALNMQLLGHHDMQGRPIYQPTVHKQGSRMIFYAGLHAGNQLNPMTGAMEPNGTLIVDVTDPSNPTLLKHLPAIAPNNSGQMVRVCDGQTGVLGQTGHFYMLRSDGGSRHDVYDVTDPANPAFLSSPLTGLTSTHKSWWECETGIAWIVAGAGAAATTPDGWNVNQHMKLYDLSDPANPVYIRDIGQVGTNPGSTTTPVSGSGVHGPIITTRNPITGELVNRGYIPYGTSSQGQLQIVDRLKVLPNRNTSAGQPMGGSWDGSRPVAPTDADMRAIVVGSMDMTPTEGAHSACPVYGMPLKHFQGFTSYTTRDYVILVSEETDNKCTGAPHFAYMVDATRAVGQGASSSGEAHPMAISTMQVFEDIAKPDYCTRGTRFGTHSCNENTAHIPSTFYPPYYGKLTFISYFDGGARAFDIRDPYHPIDVAHYVQAVGPNIQPTVVGGVTYFDVSHNNLEVDSNGIIYSVDRIGGGLDILMLTGPAALIGSSP
jgi:hypothetical protein